MTPISYNAIKAAIELAGGTESVTVQTTDLKNIFKELRRYHRSVGIMGYTNDGKVVVNEVGLALQIKEDFEHEHLAAGRKLTDIRVWRHYEGEWMIEGLCDFIKFSRLYTVNQLENKYNIIFEPS